MSRKLPYFQFEPAQYLAGDVQFCTLEAQGLFTNLCALYWQRECKLTRQQIERKYNSHKGILEELEQENIIVFDDSDTLIIGFLLEQYKEILASKERLSQAGKKGAKAKKDKAINKGSLSEVEAPLKQLDKIREEDIREEEIIEDKNIIFYDSYILEERLVSAIKEQLKLDDYQFNKALSDFQFEYMEPMSKTEYVEAKKHFRNWIKKFLEKYNKLKEPCKFTWKTSGNNWRTGSLKQFECAKRNAEGGGHKFEYKEI